MSQMELHPSLATSSSWQPLSWRPLAATNYPQVAKKIEGEKLLVHILLDDFLRTF